MDALRRQALVDGSSGIADMIASAMQLKEYQQGEALFQQGERGGELYFILAGTVSVRVAQQEVATINAGMHVGEIAGVHPGLFHRLALELGHRLVEAHRRG